MDALPMGRVELNCLYYVLAIERGSYASMFSQFKGVHEMIIYLRPRELFRFVSKMILFCLLILSLVFPAQVFAKTSTYPLNADKSGVRSTKTTLKNAVELIKLFKTPQDVLNFLVAVDPKSGIGQWNDYFKNKKVDMKSVVLSNFHYEGNRVNLPGIADPFTVSADGLTYTYRGVDFTFNFQQSPEKNIRRMQSAWGGFKSLGFAANGTRSLMNLLISQASAVSAERVVGSTVMGGLAVCIALVAWVMASEGIAFAAATFALAVAIVAPIAGLAYAGHSVQEKVKDLELRCTPKPDLWSRDSENSFQISLSNGPGVPPIDPAKLSAELKRICEAGRTPVGMFNMKLKTVISDIKENKIQFAKPNNSQVPNDSTPSGATP